MSIRAAIALVGTLSMAGCLDGFTGDQGVDAGNNGGDDGGMMQVDVISDFNTNVAPMLVGADGKSGACGACHAVAGGAGPAFLLPKPDLYTTVTSYPSLIGNAPETSRLYAKGVHEGPALSDAQAPVLAAWIVEYNANKPAVDDGGAVKPSIAPFAPIMNATNTVDLTILDPLLSGQNVSFTAKTLGGTTLELTNIKINTAPMTGVHMVHPLWVVWDASFNATPDPVDSFSNLDQTVYGMSSATMGPGTLILPGWSATSKLSVVFVQIEPKMGGADAGTIAGCKALQNFVTNVKPLLQANCNACHVGANPTAGLSFDFGANSDATVCMNALTEINTTTVANSLLLQRPNPAVNDAHPRKIATFGPYQTAVTNWINLEK
jgi:mono/diheme cytochrome c family protein